MTRFGFEVVAYQSAILKNFDGENVCHVPPKLEEALVKEFIPEKVLLSERRVEEALEPSAGHAVRQSLVRQIVVADRAVVEAKLIYP